MVREKFCPQCGEDISDSYEAAEPDVGIMAAGWYCDPCQYIVCETDEPNWDF